ncbi:MAG: PIN domain-containing protein [Trueperaceae bacterium]
MLSAIDTNVISALWSREPKARKLALLLGRAREEGGLVVCAPVHAQLFAHPTATPAFIEQFLVDTGIDVDFQLSEAVWRGAGEAFASYAERRRDSGGGQPKRLLVDFLVGAHALFKADRLLTLDPARYQTAYPALTLVERL